MTAVLFFHVFYHVFSIESYGSRLNLTGCFYWSTLAMETLIPNKDTITPIKILQQPKALLQEEIKIYRDGTKCFSQSVLEPDETKQKGARNGPSIFDLYCNQCSRLKPSYEFHFEGLSNIGATVEGLVQIQNVDPRT